jgi:hypothetical protein
MFIVKMRRVRTCFSALIDFYSVNEVERLNCEAFDTTSGTGEKPNS